MSRDGNHRSGRLSGNTLSLVLPGGPRAAAEARSALGVLARELEPSLLPELRLLVSELVTNSVTHGQAGPDDPIRLEVAVSNGGVRVEVTDLGPGFTPSSPTTASQRLGGWGLVFVDRISARWGTDQRGRCVWFELESNGRPTASGDRIG